MSNLTTHPDKEAVQLTFRCTEKEYLAATRLYFWHSKEVLARFAIVYVLVSSGLVFLSILLDFLFPVWALVSLIVLMGIAWFHAGFVDFPRRYFRSDPRFRDEQNVTFTDAGIEYKTQEIRSSIAWSFYTGVIENDSFYLMLSGKDLHSVSILPKRAFRDSKQETTFRELLRRHVDHTLKLSAGEREKEYVPPSLEPPDWR